MDAIGSKAALKRAHEFLGPEAPVEAAAAFFSRGGVLTSVLTTGIAGAAGGLPAGLILTGVRHATAQPTAPQAWPKLMLLTLMPDRLLMLTMSPGTGRVLDLFGEIDRRAYRVLDVRTVGLVAKRMPLQLSDRSVVELDTKYIGMNRHNPRVIEAIAAAGRL